MQKWPFTTKKHIFKNDFNILQFYKINSKKI